MFTGIIQEVGKVAGIAHARSGVCLSIAAPVCAAELQMNDSVAVNGVCQTVIEKEGSVFKVEAVEETLSKTTLGELHASELVNIELPLRLSDRLGGHLVAGHVDTVGIVRGVKRMPGSSLITVEFPASFRRYLIPVGSIAIDGISLTIAALKETEFIVSIIPHTMEKTTITRVAPGSRVNLEFDLVGKYLESIFMSNGKGSSVLSPGKLREWGYEA